MAVKHSVRSTLATLLVGVVAQRLLQLAAFLCIGHALGAEGLGIYAQGLAAGGLLSVLAGASVRSLLARSVARSPDAVGTFVRRACRARLANGALLAAVAAGVAFATSDQPWFWTICVLHVLPAAFDMKELLDAAGRTRAEVLLESATSLLHLLLVAAWATFGGDDLLVLAAISLASRTAYALLALPTIARLPAEARSADAPFVARRLDVALGHTLHGSLIVADVWLVALCFGNAAAGLYAVAIRFAGAALLPSMQLARLLLPHMLHAATRGDSRRTLDTASRATALATLPMLAGGAVVAERLCALPGPEFAGAAPALAFALLAGCLQHAGWQRSHALLAAGRERAYAAGLVGSGLLQITAMAGCGTAMRDADAVTAATTAALVAALAQLVYFVAGLRAAQTLAAPTTRNSFVAPLAVAAATAVGAAFPGIWLDGPAALPTQLVAGGLAFAIALWCVELRGRVRRIGDGLAKASGFRS